MNKVYIYTLEQKEEFFGKGEWCTEPDIITFDHKGLKCIINRVITRIDNLNYFGVHLCGYVYVPKDNEIYDKRWSKCPIDDVHGGLTSFEKNGDDFVIGFDCAHSDDLMPCMIKICEVLSPENRFINLMYTRHKTYKNVEFVINETKNLAEQVERYNKK